MTKRINTPMPARVAKVGVQDYLLSSFVRLGVPVPDSYKELPGDTIIKVLRPKEEVFNEASLTTLEGKPVTFTHPPVFFDKMDDTLKPVFKKGKVVSKPIVDGDTIRVDLVVEDQQTVDLINQGVNQISLGYRMKPVWGEGYHERHGVYDARFTEIRIDHVAIEPKGRAGPHIRILDSEERQTMAVRIVDGFHYPLPDDDNVLQAFDTLVQQRDNAEQQIQDSSAEISRLKGEMVVKDEKLKELSDPAKLEAEIQRRVEVMDSAKKIAKGIKISPAQKVVEVQKEAIQMASPHINLEGMNEDNIDGVFRALVEMHKAEPPKPDVVSHAVNAATDSAVDRTKSYLQLGCEARDKWVAANRERQLKFAGRR